MIASTIGLDLAKHIFHVHAVDAAGSVVRTAALRRGEMIKFFGMQSHALLVWKRALPRTIGLAS